MNHIYKVVFCKATNTFVAVTEYARAHGKSSSGSVGSSSVAGKFSKLFALTALSSAVMVGANAAVVDGQQTGTGNAAGAIIIERDNIGSTTAESANFIGIGGDFNTTTGRVNTIKIGSTPQDQSTGGGGDVLVGHKITVGGGNKDSFSTAVGNYTHVAGPSVALGAFATADPLTSTGPNSMVSGQVAVGAGASTGANKGDAGIAIGAISSSRANQSTAIGRLSLVGAFSADGLNTNNSDFDSRSAQGGTAVGERASARGGYSIATGTDALVGRQVSGNWRGISGNNSAHAIATGYNSRAVGQNTIAMGNNAIAGGYTSADAATVNGWVTQAQTIYDAAKEANDKALETYNAVPTGGLVYNEEVMKAAALANLEFERAQADLWRAQEDAKLILTDGQTNLSNAIAVGNASRALNQNAIAMGNQAGARGTNSVAIGSSASTTIAAQSGVAIGHGATTSGVRGIAIGTNAQAIGSQSISVGTGNIVRAENAGAFGDPNTIEATATGSYAVGNNNTISGANTFVLGNNVNATVGNNVILGNASSQVSSTTPAGIAKAVDTATVEGVTYSGFAGDDVVAGVVSVGSTTATRQIINVAPGEISETSTDAINGSQLYLMVEDFTKWSKGNTDSLGGNASYDPVTNTYTAPTYNIYKGSSDPATAGNGDTQVTGAPANNVGAAITALNSYINEGFKVLDNGGATRGVVTPGESIQFVNGTNTTANVTTESNGVTKISFNATIPTTTLNQDTDALTFSVPNGQGNSYVNASSLASALNNTGFLLSGSSIGGEFTSVATDKKIVNGDTFHLKANTGIKINQIDNGYEIGVDIPDPETEEVVTVSNGTVLPVDNETGLVTAGNLADNLRKTGFKVSANTDSSAISGSDQLVNTGETLNFNNGTGTTVEVSGANVKVNVNTAKAPDVNTDGTIAKPADGDNSYLTANDVVDAINSASFNVIGAGNNAGDAFASTPVKAGDTITYEAGDNLTIVQQGAQFTFATAKEVVFDSVKAGPVTINADGIDAGNKPITNVAPGEEPNDAVNVSQLNAAKTSVEEGDGISVTTSTNEDGSTVYNVAAKVDDTTIKIDENGNIAANTTPLTNDATNGTVNAPANPNALATAGDIADAINNSGFLVTSGKTDGENSGSEEKLVKTGEMVTFNAGENLEIVQDGATFEFKTKKDVKFDSVQYGDNGPIISNDGNGNLKVGDTNGEPVKITNVAPGEEPNDAVNVSQLNAAKTSVEEGDGISVTTSTNEDGSTVYNVAAKVDDTTIKIDENGNIAANTTPLTNDATNGTVNAPANPNALATAGDIADAINNSGFLVTSGKTDGENSGSEEKLVKTGEMVTFNAGENLEIVQDGATFEFKTKKDVKFDSVQYGDNGPIISNDGNGNLKVGDTNGEPVKITNVAPGEEPNDAVNVSQLNAAKTSVEEGDGISVTTSTNEDGSTVYNVAAKVDDTTIKIDENGNIAANTTPLTNDATNGTVNAPANPNALATAGDIADAINNSGFLVTSGKTDGENSGSEEKLVKTGEMVTFNAGENLEIVQDGATFEFKTKKDVKFDSVQYGDNGPIISNDGNGNLKVGDTNGEPVKITNVAPGEEPNDAVNVSQLNAAKTSVEEGDGISVTTSTNEDGSTVYNVAAKVDDTTIKIDENGNIAANTTPLTNDATNGTVNAPANPNALATAGDIADAINNSGFLVTSGKTDGENSGSEEKLVKTGEMVTFNAGENLEIVQDGATFEFKTKKDVKFDSVQYGDNGPIISNDGNGNLKVGDTNGEPVKITNVAPGEEPNDAVNVSQLNAAKTSVEEGDGISVTTSTNEDGSTVYNVAAKVDDTTIKIDENGNIAANTTPLTNDATNGTVNAPANPNALATAGDIADAINNSGFLVTSGKTDGENSGSEEKLVKTGEMVTFNAGENLEIVQDGATFEFKTKKDVKFDSVQYGDNGPIISNDGNGNLKVGDTNGEPVKITNVASTLPDTYSTANDANNPDGKAPTTAQQVPSLTADELNNVATVGDVLNAGWNLKTEDQGDLDFVKPYDTVEFVNGKGTTVESKTDGETSTITYNVNVDNATTYITAKDAAGNTLYQGADGKFYTGPNSQGEAVEPVGDTYITANVAVIDAKVGSVNAKDGKAEVGAGTSPTDAVSAGSVADTINKVGFTVTANDPAAGDVNNDGLVNAGETLNFADGANTKVVVEGNTVTYNVTGLPVQYTTEDGQPVAKVGDSYYPVGKDGLPDTSAAPIPADQLVTNVVNPAASPDQIGAPTKLGNIASTLPATYNDDALNTAGVAPTTTQALPELTPAQLSNAATIGDVLNAGWNLQNNGEARDFVKPYDIVNFVDGQGTTAVVTTAADGVSSDVTYNANYDNLTINVGGTAYKVTQNPDGTYTYVLPGAGTDAGTGTGGLKVNGNPDTVNNNTSPEGQGSILINGQGTHVSVDNSTGEIKVDSPLAYVGNETAGDTSTATDTVSFVGATTDAPVQAQNLASGVRDILASGGDALPSAYINAGTDANGNPVSATTYTPAQRQAIAAAVNNASGDTLTNAANIGDVQAAAAAAKTEVRAGENVRVDTATGDNGQTIYTVHAAAPDLSPINKRLDDIEKGANAGVSSAMAMATLPQAYIPGKSMLTGGVASYNGEGAVAVGFSKLSDNGRWVLKMSGSADTDGNVGGAVGAGFHF